MKLKEISIKNFRCLVDVVIPITDTTVLVGENNSGKTALLEALRIALPRSTAGRGTPFTVSIFCGIVGEAIRPGRDCGNRFSKQWFARRFCGVGEGF